MTHAAVERSRESGWAGPPGDRFPALAGELACDVAVVGGGYTGMAAALRLAERGADVALLETEHCGAGASSRNAGHLTPTIAGDPQLLATVYRRRAAELVRLADAAVHFTEGLIERLAIECEYEATGNVSAALSEGQLRRAERIARFLAGVGAEVEFVRGAELGLPDAFRGGVHERAGGVLNPGRLARGLRAALAPAGVKAFEGTPASAIEPAAGRLAVTAPAGRVRAERVLVATNAYSRDLRFAPRRAVTPLWITLAETEPLGAERLAASGWTSGAGIYTQHVILESYRPTARGTVVFGSRQAQPARGALGSRAPDEAVVADIARGFRDRFPGLRDAGVRRAWGGWIAMTGSWLPLAGEAEPGVLYMIGCNGHGVAQAPYLGTLVADVIAGDEPHDDLRAVWRRRPRFAPAPLFSAPALRAGWALDRLADRRLRRRAVS